MQDIPFMSLADEGGGGPLKHSKCDLGCDWHRKPIVHSEQR